MIEEACLLLVGLEIHVMERIH